MTLSLNKLAAARDLADLDPSVWCDIATSLTCTEAEVIAAFLTAWDSDGECLLSCHSDGDDEGDMHEPVYNDDGLLTGFTYRDDPEG